MVGPLRGAKIQIKGKDHEQLRSRGGSTPTLVVRPLEKLFFYVRLPFSMTDNKRELVGIVYLLKLFPIAIKLRKKIEILKCIC